MGLFLIIVVLVNVLAFFFWFFTAPNGSHSSRSAGDASSGHMPLPTNPYTDAGSPLNVVTNPCNIYHDP